MHDFMVLTVASADMLQLFDPPINDIIKLLDSQLNSAKKKEKVIHVSVYPICPLAFH
jgi:hypothetical protein